VAADRLTAGLAGGFTPAARQEARALAAKGAGEPGAELVADLINTVPDDDTDVPDPVRGGVDRVVRWLDALVDRAWAAWLLICVLLLVGAAEAMVGIGVVLAAVGASAVLLAVGVVVGRRNHLRGAVWVRRAVLVSLLFTQLLVFRAVQWTAAFGLLLDVLAFMALEVALREERMVRERDA
jgi:hypothetical protein